MLIVADSGSTNTNWVLRDNSGKIVRITSPGLNPNFSNVDLIKDIIQQNVLPYININQSVNVKFYGSGCGGSQTVGIVEKAFVQTFKKASIYVASDLLGAARSVFGDKSGIACILGTGSNSGYYNGSEIVMNIPPLGFILGDEGSGTYMGKVLLADYLKGIMPESLAIEFNALHRINKEEVIEKVYRGNFPAKYVAEFVKFISSLAKEEYIYSLIESSFQAFIDRNIRLYPDFEECEICFTGSVAWAFKDYLKRVFDYNNLTIGKIVKNPVDGILDYHIRKGD